MFEIGLQIYLCRPTNEKRDDFGMMMMMFVYDMRTLERLNNSSEIEVC